MSELDRQDEELARDLLHVLLDDDVEAPAVLPDKAIRKVQASMTTRDLLDLTTFVFLTRFCAPLLDLLAAFFGQDPTHEPDRRHRDD